MSSVLHPFAVVSLALLTLSLTTAGARADEVRLRDGRVLVGKVVEKETALKVTTRDGTILVAKSDVAEHKTEGELRQELARMARSTADTTFAHLQHATKAREWGLESELWKHLDHALATRPKTGLPEGLQRRLADFLGSHEAEVLPRRCRTASTKVRVHQLLDGLHASTGPARAAVIEELLVREPNADPELRVEARRNTAPRQRIAALQALQRRQLAGNDRFVLRTAILDGTESVREAAVALSRSTVSGDDVVYLASGLVHTNPKVRMRTADALGDLGHADAMKLLVLAAPNAGAGLQGGGGGNDGTRGHIAILQQTSYIRDFDVEVAQAAIIADPKVDVLQSGSVLDVTVAGVVEVRTILMSYRRALKQLAKSDPGEDPRQWPAWLAQVQSAGAAPAPTTPTTPPTKPSKG